MPQMNFSLLKWLLLLQALINIFQIGQASTILSLFQVFVRHNWSSLDALLGHSPSLSRSEILLQYACFSRGKKVFG